VIGVHEIGVEEFYCRGASHLSPTGSIVTINPHEVHTGHSTNRDKWVYRGMYPDAVLLREIATQLGGRKGGVPFFRSPVVHNERLAGVILDLHRTLETSQETLERHTKFLLTFAHLIAQHADGDFTPKPVGSERQSVKRTREYTEAFYFENITLEELARVAGLNPFYLIRVFRKELGLPPHEFLTQVRVERAKKLLSGGWPIAQVALETGFVDQSHLTNRFKRILGVTPKQFVRGSISYKTPRP
jgi:AraC-like DNA-binding protein